MLSVLHAIAPIEIREIPFNGCVYSGAEAHTRHPTQFPLDSRAVYRLALVMSRSIRHERLEFRIIRQASRKQRRVECARHQSFERG
jgi:hypothetical protein